MKRSRIFLSTIILLFTAVIAFAFIKDDDTFLDAHNQNFGSIQNLRTALEKGNKKLLFAMNGGMYNPGGSLQGLYIQDKITLSPLDTTMASGNFYLKPNGVFYLSTDNTAAICTTPIFKDNGQVKYATQSGPMLVINGQIHSAFKEGSANKNIRNGVGILSDGGVIFVLSKQAINFYDFADYFKKLGCKNALYLDGFVSRAYLPEKNWVQLDGFFGVMVGVTGK
ncbi:phosphodiester glycosidase family protein [Mucilaginibacter sp. ZT4R22]|uniref:Phosphodiester glycosidase family protein n=1 Tax=Mucilaginibacter pankratovii TaxID=2772110 RepID=A0ABR7WT63_9SPHI|nr:phosphodiester glycosidase family protein [Mucilaginibacter pankratovii]MBD1365501.1 phosphodiester glycosidase family protein [Mucilaginibacter pankratovii]